MTTTTNEQLKSLPSVSEADRHLEARGLPHGKSVRELVQAVLDGYRRQLLAGGADEVFSRQEVLRALEQAVNRPAANQLRRVINCTGVVVHTNLGRAVLPETITRPAEALHHSYLNLEFDLDTGQRGPRGGRVPQLLARLAGAEAGLAVNNNAAAVLLMLTALGQGREVIVSRGELVEIGGSFRIPDIMRASGARLVEVGTTNRTRISDYEQAITENTAALLKVHRSNFHLSGFVEETGVEELARLAGALNREREQPIGVWHDLGSGNFYRFHQPALRNIPTVEAEVRAGADIVTLSGDKLLGSAQAGIVVGRAEPLERMRKHPLYRCLRMDRVRTSLLEQSLLAYLNIDTLREHNTVIDLLERTPGDMEPLLNAVLKALEPRRGQGLSWEPLRDYSLAGGGAVPEARIETLCLALWDGAGHRSAQQLAAELRAGEPPVIVRISGERIIIDFRAVFARDLDLLGQALARLSAGPDSP
ncbi:MAG: L-seryl-tRNA(Sec) selenium transferase [Deltaproteobacteria bacterium]|nr:L-seryl-tRNA(Sec) selenium transferase [Deltaproteobacteria bacterium]